MLQWVLVGAVVIFGAIAVTGWIRAAELSRDLETYKAAADRLESRRPEQEIAVKSLTAEVTKLRFHVNAETARLEAELARAARSDDLEGADAAEAVASVMTGPEPDREAAAAALGQLQQWFTHHLTAVADETAHTRQLVSELSQYTVGQLEREAREGIRVLRCGLYARQPAVTDIGPMVLGELQKALSLEPLYRAADGPDGLRFFLTWPDDRQPPQPALRSLLRAALDVTRAAEAVPGAVQLRAIILALRDGGPSLLQFGPLLIARTEAGLAAGFVPAHWAGPAADQVREVIAGTRPDLLRELGAQDVIDLTGWAVPQLA
jgi:hypothetical protein